MKTPSIKDITHVLCSGLMAPLFLLSPEISAVSVATGVARSAYRADMQPSPQNGQDYFAPAIITTPK